MAGLFFGNDGTMGALLAGAVTGTDPYAGSNASQWAAMENTRIAQERLRMDMDVKRRELELAAEQQRQAGQIPGIEAGAIVGRVNRNLALAPTNMPAAPPPITAGGILDSGAPAGVAPAGQGLPTSTLAQPPAPPAPPPFQVTPEMQQDLAAKIKSYTYGLKDPAQIRHATALATVAWKDQHGVPLSLDDSLSLQSGVPGAQNPYTPGQQQTQAERERIYREKTIAEAQGKPLDIKAGTTTLLPGPLQEVYGTGPAVKGPVDPSTVLAFSKQLGDLDGVKRMREIQPTILQAESILAVPLSQWTPTQSAALITYAAKISDPTTGVREGEIDKWGGQGYAERIRGLVREAQGGTKLGPQAVEELRKFFVMTRQNYSSVAATELADAKRLATHVGIPWEVVAPTLMSPNSPTQPIPGSTGAPGAGAPAQAGPTVANPVVSYNVGGGPAQAQPVQQQQGGAVAATGGPLGSQANPVTGIGGPLDVAQKVPVGGWFRDHQGQVRQRLK